MPRFFVDTPPEGTAVITGEDAVHIGRSLRMRPGESLTLCCRGTDYECVISRITADEVCAEVVSSAPSAAEPSVELTLFQALPKSDKMELIIQKAVELGVSRIVPVLSERCVSRPDSKAMKSKLLRWNKIALSAAKQSGRGIIPEVAPLMSFAECIEAARACGSAFFCYEKGGRSFSDIAISGGSAAVIIGSEGGFSDEEASAAGSAGLSVMTLGTRILRCETAPLAAITAIMLRSGNM